MIRKEDWIAAAVLSIVFPALLGAAEGWRRRRQVPAEWTRKLVHIAGGLICLSFPFVIQSSFIVFLLALGLSALFAGAAFRGRLASLHGVSRRTRGTEFFPFAVWLVFVLTLGRPWLYVCALLVLAIADAGAALVGGGYGRIRYEVDGEYKSLEGSLVFLVLAFLAMHLPMLLMTDLPEWNGVLAALLVAVLVTGFEAISLGGSDNLFIPLGVSVILSKIATKPLEEIVYQCVSLFCMMLIMGYFVRRSRAFNVGGALVLILFAYACWSLGSERWALPVFSGMGVYLLGRRLHQRKSAGHGLKVRAVFRVVAFPLLFLTAGNMTHSGPWFYGPFLASLMAALSFSLRWHLEGTEMHSGRSGIRIRAGAAGAAWVAVPLVCALSTKTPGWGMLAATALVGGTLWLLIEAMEKFIPESRTSNDREAAGLAAIPAAGLAMLAFQAMGFLNPWIPG